MADIDSGPGARMIRGFFLLVGFVCKCPKCGHEEELHTGIGFMSPLEADMERESILAGYLYGTKAQAALVAYPEAPVSVERAMYQYGACGKLESRLAVTVKAPVRVPILQRCDCGATMRRIRSGKNMVCPACREPMKKKTDVAAVVMRD